jgi:glycosyltransferase involved in cell wall biosynthesis
LHITTSLGVGGAEQILVDLAKYQGQQGHNVLIVSLRDNEYWVKSLLQSQVDVQTLLTRVPANRFRYILALIFNCPRLFWLTKCFKPDVIHTWMYLADLLGGIVAFLLHRPVIWGIFSGSLHRQYYRSGTSLLIRSCAHLSRTLPALTVSCSAFGRRTHIAAGYPSKGVAYIPTGFRAVHERRLAVPVQNFASTLNTNRRKLPFRIGMLARISPEKDHSLLLRALAQLSGPDTNVVLSLAGGKGITPGSPLEAEIHELGLHDSVVLEGRVDDIGSWLSSLDLFVLLSKSEGFPTVVGEAMSFAKPCLVSDVGDVKMLLSDKAQIVPSGEIRAVVDRIKYFDLLSGSERAEIGKRNQNRVKKYFSQDLMFQRYDRVYRAVYAGIK